MTIKTVSRSLSLLFFALAAACSHTPGPDDIPPGAEFTANILADGTKLFVYTTHMAGGPGGGPGGGGGGMSRRRGGGNGDGGEEPPVRRPSAKANLEGLQAMLAQNNYCREGYVVLEQYELRNQHVIRGECRDGATDADRARFQH